MIEFFNNNNNNNNNNNFSGAVYLAKFFKLSSCSFALIYPKYNASLRNASLIWPCPSKRQGFIMLSQIFFRVSHEENGIAPCVK